MGLDMYLKAKNYISEYDENSKRVSREIADVLGVGLHVSSVELSAMYWRKANAVHAWFVKNVQEGEDDCGEYYVSREKLAQLKEACEKAVENAGKEDDGSGMAPAEGFFFGSTARDQYYYSSLAETAEAVGKLLSSKQLDGWDFYYHSSW